MKKIDGKYLEKHRTQSVSYPDKFLYHWIGRGTQILKPNVLNQSL